MSIESGSIVFVHGTGLLSKIIQFFDHGKFNHVYVQLENNVIIESQYLVNTRVINSPYHKGLTVLNLGLTDEQKDKLLHNSLKYIEDKYDIKQLIGLLFHYLFKWNTNKTWDNRNKLICSELVVNILRDIDYFSDDEYSNYEHVTPNELYNILIKRLESKKVS